MAKADATAIIGWFIHAEVILTADLVDKVKPGDRVRVYGKFQAVGGANAQATPRYVFCHPIDWGYLMGGC